MIHPVLVRPKISGNIGASVRAAKAMGMGNVILVGPHAPINKEAESLAAGAVEELAGIQSVDSLEEAVKGAVRVFGLSARRRDHRSKPVWISDAVADALAASAKGRVLFLFGTERTGLENEELDYAQVIVRIPTGAGAAGVSGASGSQTFKSLNLAQAVMITAFELRRQSGAGIEHYDYKPASVDEIERCVQAFAEALDRREFFVSSKRTLAVRRIRDLLGRAVPNENEIALLRGMIRSLDEDEVVEAIKKEAH